MERSRLSRASIGGTAVAKSRSNVPVILIAAVVVLAVAGAITYAAVHRSGDASATTTSTTAALPAAPAAPLAPPPRVVAPPPPTAAAASPTVSAGALANDLERDLQHRHLWSTVAVVGDHLDIHSSTCSDPQMKPVLDRVAGDFKTAGVRRLRCLEESGKLVFARDL
jgi:hypothetical protein